MTRTVVCSICSREKNGESGSIPAHLRYTGSHIWKVQNIAKEQGVQFFILSGVFGFVTDQTPIPYYDKLLQMEDVLLMVSAVRRQLINHKVGVVHFYTKPKPAWEPYLRLLQMAAGDFVKVEVHELAPDD